jgi:hypothetical protein
MSSYLAVDLHHTQPNKQTPWPESASELYRLSDRRLSAKLVPTFADKGVSRGQRDKSLRSYSLLSVHHTHDWKMFKIVNMSGARCSVVGWGNMLQAAGSRPDEVNFSSYVILTAALGPVVYSASNRKEYQKQKKMFLGSTARPARKAHNLTAICGPIF